MIRANSTRRWRCGNRRITKATVFTALAMGELYDPLLWGQIPSLFSKYNVIQAEKWYRRAGTLGVEEVHARLQQLEVWKREQPAADNQQ